MASLPQFKDLSKAINAYVPTGTLPLPDSLVDLIEGYVRKHEDEFEDKISDKVNEDLLQLFHKSVANKPSRYAPFMAVLRRLRPLIGQADKVLGWSDLLMPIMDHLTQEKDLASESQGLVLEILTADEDEDASSPLKGVAIPMADKLLSVWLDECIVAGRTEDNNQSFKEKHLRDALLQYGRKRPKDLMTLMNKYLVRRSCRARILLLVADFVKSQPPHLYTILQTPLFTSLLTCLQQDTSTTIISLALGVLTMVLPHVPSSLVPHLPTLFNIYARLLFWERLLSNSSATESQQDPRFSPNPTAWEKCVFSSSLDGTTVQYLMSYYTVLYGLYPINFTDYIRKPERYLRHAESSEADDVEVQPTEIRHATERFRQCHLLHENFYTLTIDSEKTDFGRWIKSEPAEVVADCASLCVTPDWHAEHYLPDIALAAPDKELDGLDESGETTLLGVSYPGNSGSSGKTQPVGASSPPDTSDSQIETQEFHSIARKASQASHHSNRDSSITRVYAERPESPPLPRQLVTSGSQTRLQDLINSNKAIKSGLHQSLKNDSVPSLALSQHESISERLQAHLVTTAPPSLPTIDHDQSNTDTTGQLYRQILLLQNDLIFERFMKQQHLTHMGELRRRQMREAATEAEAQNLMITNRHLKQRLAESKSIELQVKKEAEGRRTLAKKWEADLTTKLRTLREEQKKWTAREKSLISDLEASKSENEKLVKLVCDAEVRELGLKQNMQSVELHVNELERLREEVKKATEAERNFQAREAERQNALTRADEADGRAEGLRMQLEAVRQELQLNQERHSQELSNVNTELQNALKKGSDRKTDDLRSKLNATIAGARAQQDQFRKRMEDFSRKNNALQAELLKLQSNMPVRRQSDPLHEQRRRAEISSDSEDLPQTHLHRGFSNPEPGDLAAYNATPPLTQIRSSTSTGSQDAGPLIDPVPDRAGSPATDLFLGRDVISTSKKDKKDKKDDKEKRKLVGIRGIRGFV